MNVKLTKTYRLAGVGYLLLALTLLVGTPGAVFAQAGQDAANEGVLEEVVILGFRKSIEAAMDVKRDSTAAVDAIVAEDIADFPDLNLAESLQRIPGIAIRREGGEGRNITVRGLGPDFNRVRVNGMEGLGTSGGTDSSGGSNRSRQFDFNIFASELFNQVVIRKTAEARVDEGSIGATIDLRTARPFDFDGRASLVSTQMLYNDLSEEWNPRVSALYSNLSEDGSWGGLIAVSYSERTIFEEGASTVRWQHNDFVSCSACGSQAEFDRVNAAYHPRIPRYGRLIHDQERTGVNAALQFRPNDDTEIVFEALYGNLDGSRAEQFLEALIRNNEDEMDVTAYTIDGDNNLINGTFDNSFIRVENRIDYLETDFTQFTLTGAHNFTDDLKLIGLVGTSESDFQNPIQTTIIFDNIVDGYRYDYSANGNLPALDYGFDVTDPTAFDYTEFRDRPNHVVNDFDLVKFDLEWDFSDTATLSTGINFKEYGFDVAEARRDDQVRDVLGDSVPVTASIATLLTGLEAPAGVDTSWVIPNIAAAAALVDLYNLPANPRSGDIRNVNEENTSVYVQVDWESALGNGNNLRGNFGVRWFETDLKSTGILSGDTVTVTNSYDDVLPALNLALDIGDDMVLRGSWAEVITRPTLGSLTPGGSIGVFGDPTLSFGNPSLAPFQADAFDVAFEWYFREGAALSIAAFWKDIDSFIARISEDNIPFNTLGLPCSLLDASPIEGECDTLFTVTRNVNGNGGDLDGYELSFIMPFSNSGGWLSNMGVIANYTSVDSTVDYAAPGSTSPNLGPLVGLSEESWNLTFYYEDEKFSARISGNYRDEFLIQFPDRAVEEATYIDFASTYNVNDQWQLTFEVINLTDEDFNQRHLVGGASRPYVFHHTGTNYFLGARWKY
jgi:TonB-dependent receptor